MTSQLPPDDAGDNADADRDPFTALRPRLFSIAYRMLGTRADADDVLQDAWLPEPLVTQDPQPTPEAAVELASELSVAFLWLLERLSPEERAAFLLRQVFDYDYDEIAVLLGKKEAACRQMVHRASIRVQRERPRFDVPADVHRGLLEKFMEAAHSGGRDAIKALLADNVEIIGDGGGKVPSFMKVVYGADRITNLYWDMPRRLGMPVVYRIAQINGEPGLLRYIGGKLESAQAFVTDGQRIVAIYAVRNPDKLAGIPLFE